MSTGSQMDCVCTLVALTASCDSVYLHHRAFRRELRRSCRGHLRAKADGQTGFVSAELDEIDAQFAIYSDVNYLMCSSGSAYAYDI